MSDIPEFVVNSVPWNPWHGCHRVSEGCARCYMFEGDRARGVDGSGIVRKSKTQFDLPLKKDRRGFYILRNRLVLTSLTSDFFIEEADEWRDEAWKMMHTRSDCVFVVLTTRPERMVDCLPDDWGSGYPNVRLSVSVENQRTWDERIPILFSVPACRHDVFLAPMIGPVDADPLMSEHHIDGLYLGGEICKGARVCDYSWVLAVREACVRHGTTFHWRNSGTNLMKDGHLYQDLDMRAQGAICYSAGLDYVVDRVMPRTVRQSTLF